MDYRYGSGPDEVNEFFRAKRSWSNVKDRILGHYINCYLKTVPYLRKRIVIVDGFAGPGVFGDDSAGSPLIICREIEETAKGYGIKSLFADVHPGHRNALERNLAQYIAAGICEKPLLEWSEALSRALALGTSGDTLFFYLDPYGIKELEFEIVRQIYERDPRRSTEVLINFSLRTLLRMSGNLDLTETMSEASRKVKLGKIDTINRVLGGDYWIPILSNPALTPIQREDAIIDAYVDQLRRFFKHAYAIPIKERGEQDGSVPDDELARYHLIFGTRSPRAVTYMNDVGLNALAPYLKQFTEGVLFDVTPERYTPVDRELVKAAIVKTTKGRRLNRQEILEAVIPDFFMQYRKKDYRLMIEEIYKAGTLRADPATMKTPGRLNENTRLY